MSPIEEVSFTLDATDDVASVRIEGDGDVGAAMAAANDGQTNLTQVMFDTPGNIGDDGRIWVLVDGAAIFSAHCSASAAAAQRTLYGGQMRSFVLNAGKAAGGDMAKAQLDGFNAALSKPTARGSYGRWP